MLVGERTLRPIALPIQPKLAAEWINTTVRTRDKPTCLVPKARGRTENVLHYRFFLLEKPGLGLVTVDEEVEDEADGDDTLPLCAHCEAGLAVCPKPSGVGAFSPPHSLAPHPPRILTCQISALAVEASIQPEERLSLINAAMERDLASQKERDHGYEEVDVFAQLYVPSWTLTITAFVRGYIHHDLFDHIPSFICYFIAVAEFTFNKTPEGSGPVSSVPSSPNDKTPLARSTSLISSIEDFPSQALTDNNKSSTHPSSNSSVSVQRVELALDLFRRGSDTSRSTPRPISPSVAPPASSFLSRSAGGQYSLDSQRESASSTVPKVYTGWGSVGTGTDCKGTKARPLWREATVYRGQTTTRASTTDLCPISLARRFL
ncbi:uncharacterized protein HD556DRAFT_1312394 [Suillus plorans]|uniref:Uncharacterized protein n=1 Tax=Suillus plorans TaxID=116603 RepID=A0A9P7AEU0_9AGAM|nr:uncharacterized protein HD556DRAFT_1312394 [Suillus plorans]KAG1787969.1 hypothetical protein HD556DRAFT_1312394 [Suillus plorans]